MVIKYGTLAGFRQPWMGTTEFHLAREHQGDREHDGPAEGKGTRAKRTRTWPSSGH